MRDDPESRALAEAARAAVLQRANGLCERCGVSEGVEPTSFLEGVPEPGTMLALCPACLPRTFEEVGSLARIDALVAALRRMRER